MLNQRRHQAQRRHSSVLDLEAANYFKLDLAQVHLLGQPEAQTEKNHQREESSPRPGGAHRVSPCRQHQESTKAARKSTSKRPAPNGSDWHRCEEWRGSSSRLIGGADDEEQQHKRRAEAARMEARRRKAPAAAGAAHKQRPSGSLLRARGARLMASSSSGSTSSLPSISSSPSVSPSLVCPHLSLDDILTLGEQRDESAPSSPHTIGLCARCRLNPPPNVHSPLSPTFAPSKCASSSSSAAHKLRSQPNTCNQVPSRAPKQHQQPQMRRFNSDHQPAASQANREDAGRRRQTRDDSLDYYLAPEEARRLELSPTLRHSVEYLRNNAIEAGRVLRVHKNGLPFDKPLRICITRGEFANVNQLLDHINSRQLVPLGARYLFHLDGQLVYSVNELKHGSIYIVSGTRTFDFKANSLLREASDRQLELSRARRGDFTTTTAPAERSHSSLVDARSSGALQAPALEERVVKASAVKVATNNSSPKRQLGKRAKQSPARHAQLAREEAAAARRAMSKSEECLEWARPCEALSLKGPKESAGGGGGGACLVRAKSELDGATSKRKKNVTFVDTGRGSSPAISVEVGVVRSPTEPTSRRKETSTAEDSSIRALKTNEIGIQVSDSIEGFLIDLPLALPPSKREVEDAGNAESSPTKRRDFLRKGQGQRQRAGPKQAQAAQSRVGEKARKAALEKAPPKGATRRQIVTLSERQLSLDEMSQLKDLDHGDHHSESELSKRANRIIIKLEHVDEAEQAQLEEAQQQQQQQQQQQLERASGADEEKGWEYPGGRESSATPTERPVSQNEASEQVHARVTTPSPSMSGAGDNASLSLDTNSLGSLKAAESPAGGVELARPAVRGRLCRGSSAPEENFTLSWVNGFAINDQYPENSATPPAQPAAGGGAARLSPQQPAATAAGSSPAPQPSEARFKPGERFHNWLCHSRKHDELVYPAGSLIVLWSRWSNQQRYYARHTSNVSALTLAALHADLAASAQLAEPTDKSTCSQVHLWSLSSLELLQVIDDDHFRGRRIFSLKLGSPSPVDGACELSAAARDDKRLWLYDVSLKLAKKAPGQESPLKQTKPARQAAASSSISVIKLNKPLQANQTPLGLTRLRPPTPTSSSASAERNKQQVEVLASVGRRHFQLSLVDRRQLRLRPMKAADKSARLVESIPKASCFVRLAANELVLGDSDGNIALLRLDFRAAALSRSPAKGAGEQQASYKMETLCQLNAANPTGAALEAQQRACAITCLARVSGNLFASADSSSALRLWRLESRKEPDGAGDEPTKLSCRQLSSVSLPADLGFVCALAVARYSRKPSAMVEFYLASSSNALLFGQLEFGCLVGQDEQREPRWSLSVLYEGHEAAALGLVADVPVARPRTRAGALIASAAPPEHGHYFTCSPDQTICKWAGRQLSWKSRLPSACASLAVHPTGFVLAAGSADGTVYILDKVSGLLVSYLALTPVCINCLAYSREGLLLAAGCANGSIFILPVQERGLKYQKVSIFQSPYPVVSLQFSRDSRFLLTSVTHALYQELILWDLPNFRYMRDNVKLVADKIAWHEPICSGSEDVRAIWENANISLAQATGDASLRQPLAKRGSFSDSTSAVVNLSCHRLTQNRRDRGKQDLAIASDMRGYLRLFRYPCYDIQQGFYEIRVTSSPVNCCRFLAPINKAAEENVKFVSLSSDGSICLWTLEPTTEQ